MISEFCIRRPVATLLMSMALILAGIFAYSYLPVAALPSADFPVINVNASLPGASPETMAVSVATPLIKQFSTISGIDTIATSNTLGSTSITIQFVLGRNIDAAASDVQAAIARTQRQLPAAMTSPPSYRKVNPADAPVLLLALTSDTVPLSQLDAFAQTVISPALSTLDGVAEVNLFGSQAYAVRIQVDPRLLAARGISIDQLQNAIANANSETPLGTISNAQQQLTIVADTNLQNAADFANIIVSAPGAPTLRLGDVAHVIDSVAVTTSSGWYDGTPSIILAVQRQPNANTVEVVDRVKAMLPSFLDQLPGGAKLQPLNDRSTSIRSAVSDVEFTLGLTIILVVAVIFLFLRRVTATIIPAVAVPISLIATLGAMYLLGASIDNISLMGMTLAVGLVVDDAIVMLENIYRHMEEGAESAFEAALKGSREIGFTIISISLSLVAVFIPILLMGGVVGRIMSEFAVVVTVAILASMFVSLTLTPMLCSRLLRLPKRKRPEEGAERRRNIFIRGYDRALGFCLHNRWLIGLLFLATTALSVWLLDVAPKGFFPQEDIGQLGVTTQARVDISYPAMVALQTRVADIFAHSPYVAHVGQTAGSGNGGALNTGRMFVELKPKSERPPLATVLTELRRQLAAVPGMNVFMVPVQNLSVGSRASASQYQLVVQSLDTNIADEWATKLADAMSQDRTHFTDVTSDLSNGALQAQLVVDSDKASSLGVNAAQIRSILNSQFGTKQVSTIYSSADSYQVIMEADPRIAWSPDMLLEIKVPTSQGTLVPVGAFATVERTAGPLAVNQLGQAPAVTISYNLPDGISLGDSTDRIASIEQEIGLPATVFTSFAGTAKTFQDSVSNQGLLIMAAVLTIYIVLGILYESFIHPLTILSGLPSAVAGALLALTLAGMDLSLIAIIGILMLIGIVKKNGIMMVDVAVKLRRTGLTPIEAIHQACLMRFRPIMMTTLAALMGTLPIALGAGASAELRQPLGVAVAGGLVVSQTLTLFMTPVIYLYMESLSAWLRERFHWQAHAEGDAS
jgi:HAE1 family hydrophobic/amphiphilic exporter-1